MLMIRWIERLFRRRRIDYEREVSSPDGRVVAKFLLRGGRMGYELYKDGKVLLGWSRLGFKFHGMPTLSDELSLVRAQGRSVKNEWETVVGEDRVVVVK